MLIARPKLGKQLSPVIEVMVGIGVKGVGTSLVLSFEQGMPCQERQRLTGVWLLGRACWRTCMRRHWPRQLRISQRWMSTARS